nr:MAG TPA: hypothetical protein [Caudoviricetes sp.]
MEDWIKKLENYECDGQMELSDFLPMNQKDEEDHGKRQKDICSPDAGACICIRYCKKRWNRSSGKGD